MIAKKLRGWFGGGRLSSLLGCNPGFYFGAQYANAGTHVDSLFADAVKTGGVATGFGHDGSFGLVNQCRSTALVGSARQGRPDKIGALVWGHTRGENQMRALWKQQRAGTLHTRGKYRRAGNSW